MMTTWANSETPPDQRAEWAAMVACFAMIAYQLGAKAVRDAFFLTQVEVTSLPLMVIAAAMLSIATVLGTARAVSRLTPARIVPAAFGVSAVAHLLIWLFSESHPRGSAVAVYLLSVGVGSILTSGFWSMLNERFDTYSAKSIVGRVAGAGTLGGIVSGLVAERIAVAAPLTTMLPVLAFYQMVCGLVLLAMAPAGKPMASRSEQPEASGLAVMRQAPYLRTLAALVILGTMSAAMIDYVFKLAAVAQYGKGEQLLRFLTLFYGGVSVLSFLVQVTLSRLALTSLGTARTVATLPFAVTAGSLLALIAGGLWTMTIARGLESVLRGSLFRAAYEIFYMPMPLHEKRAAKGLIEVAFDRLGDAAGSGAVSLLILLGVTNVSPAVLAGAVLVSLAGLYVASTLEGAYVNVLEHGMRDRASEVVAATTAHESLGLSMFGGSITLPHTITRDLPDPVTLTGVETTQVPVAGSDLTGQPGGTNDPLLRQIALLRSGSRNAIRRAAPEAAMHPELIPHLIVLFGRDDVAQAVTQALATVAERHAGQLIDALRSDSTSYSIGHRIPRVLRETARQVVADGLLLGLNDRRFEVRFECGRALAGLASRNRLLRFVPNEIFGYIQKEVAVSKPVWESHRLLDPQEDREHSPIFDEFLRARTSRGLQHIFALLSLVMPAEPLRLAFQGLHVDDQQLRGTALEYLSSALPREILFHLWPLIDDNHAREGPHEGRSREQALAELMRADQTIYLRIEESRKRTESSQG